jgi:predicted RND superfamily exporter protein
VSLSGVYQKFVLTRPRLVLSFITLFTLIGVWYSQDFELDASGESLVLENDESLAYYREIRGDYGTDEFLVVTYTPYTSLLSGESLQGLRSLRDQFTAIDSVETVNSILDVPILFTAEKKLSDLDDNLQTLEGGDVDKETAIQEFTTNPFYKDFLVSEDSKTTALQIIFKFDERQYELINERERLHEIAGERGLSDSEESQLTEVNEQILQHNSQVLRSRAEDVETIRHIMDGERDKASMFLGGLPMIVADMIDYIQSDLVIFGFGVFIFLILILSVFFHYPRWVVIPLFCCVLTAVLMFGFLGLVGWRITVISSNFMSILLILTLSLTVHLIVRFRDLQIERPELSQYQLTGQTVTSMAAPCFYTALTTMVAFASLVVSNIRPVIDFGWVMIIGLSVGFILSFLLFPSALSLIGPARPPSARDFTRKFTIWLSMIVRKGPRTIITIAFIISVIIGIGMSQLKVENRFIDNFKSSTEIYQGMIVIDRELGGTTPLEVIIDPETDEKTDAELYPYHG